MIDQIHGECVLVENVQCHTCGFSQPGSMTFCPQCGAAVFATVIDPDAPPLDDDDDEDHKVNFVDSGGVSFLPMFLQSVAHRQLREICAAAQQGELDPDTFGYLCAELEVYLERQVLEFKMLPELDHPGFTTGRSYITDGLQLMVDAVKVAADWPEQGRSALTLAVKIATDADILISQGRQILDRAAA